MHGLPGSQTAEFGRQLFFILLFFLNGFRPSSSPSKASPYAPRKDNFADASRILFTLSKGPTVVATKNATNSMDFGWKFLAHLVKTPTRPWNFAWLTKGHPQKRVVQMALACQCVHQDLHGRLGPRHSFISAAWDGFDVTNGFDLLDVTNGFGLLEVASRGHQTDDIWSNLDTTYEVMNAVAGKLYCIAVGGFRTNGTFQLFGSVQSWTPLPIVLPTVSTSSTASASPAAPPGGADLRPSPSPATAPAPPSSTPSTAAPRRRTGRAPHPQPRFLPPSGEPLSFRTGTVRAAAYRAGWLPSAIATSTRYALQAMAPFISPPGQPLPSDTPAVAVAVAARP